MIQLLVSLIKVRKRRVPRTDPWDTPLTTGSLLDDSPPAAFRALRFPQPIKEITTI